MPPKELLLNSSSARTTRLNINVLIFHPDSNPTLEWVAKSSLAFMELAADRGPPPQFLPKQLFLRAI